MPLEGNLTLCISIALQKIRDLNVSRILGRPFLEISSSLDCPKNAMLLHGFQHCNILALVKVT